MLELGSIIHGINFHRSSIVKIENLMAKKVIVVLPAYNAEHTLQPTLDSIPKNIIDDFILVDDQSSDRTVEVARGLGLKHVFIHTKNTGYGGNQKTCYTEALRLGADIVIMVHPDHQYDPGYIPELIKPLQEEKTDACFGSRMLIPGGALRGGMPYWKYIANIFLTKLENLILGMDLSEYHSGFRAYSRKTLKTVPFMLNSNNFVFDTEVIAQMKIAGLHIREIPIATRYFPGASMIGFVKSVEYGFHILLVLGKYLVHQFGLHTFSEFVPRS